jgi:hypothetical protein
VQPAISHQIARSRPTIIRPATSRRLVNIVAIFGVFFFLCTERLSALTLAELRADQNLTPERFMKHFANFKFELGHDVQKPDAFLASQCGDCDDFATLAADILHEKGYSTRLIVVYMPHDTHVVCYVAETHSYLDYNCRKLASPLVECESTLESIGAHVAESFRTQWRSVSEFTYRNGARYFVNTVFR